MWEFFQYLFWPVSVYFLTSITTYVVSFKYACHTLVLIITSVFEISTLELKDVCRAKAPLGRLPGSAYIYNY